MLSWLRPTLLRRCHVVSFWVTFQDKLWSMKNCLRFHALSTPAWPEHTCIALDMSRLSAQNKANREREWKLLHELLTRLIVWHKLWCVHMSGDKVGDWQSSRHMRTSSLVFDLNSPDWWFAFAGVGCVCASRLSVSLSYLSSGKLTCHISYSGALEGLR